VLLPRVRCGLKGASVPHLLLTSALLFALLVIVAVAIGASLRIAHDLLFEGADEERDDEVQWQPGYAHDYPPVRTASHGAGTTAAYR
jgi:hypothetical protein